MNWWRASVDIYCPIKSVRGEDRVDPRGWPDRRQGGQNLHWPAARQRLAKHSRFATLKGLPANCKNRTYALLEYWT